MTLEEALQVWQDTPYVQGACEPKRGVDCVRFVDDVLQKLAGRTLEPLPREAQGAALHNARVFLRVQSLMRQRHGGFSIDIEKDFLPADILGIAEKSNPYHAAIVGPDGISAYHACPLGVVKTSVQALRTGGFKIRQAWRITR